MKREELFRRAFTAMEGKIVEEVSCGRLPKLTTLCYNIQVDEGEGNKEEDKKDPSMQPFIPNLLD